MRRRFVRTRRPVREDAFDQVRALAELDVETPLERRETVIFDLVADERGAKLSFEGRELRFPARVGAELEFVAAAEGPFRARRPARPAGRRRAASCWAAGSCAKGFLRISSRVTT